MSTNPLEILSTLSPDQIQAVIAMAGKLQQNDAGSEPKKQPRKRRTQVKHFTEVEIAAFFKAIQNSSVSTKVRDYAIFRVMYHRGLRASEIGLLQLSDFDGRDERLNVTRLKGSRGGQYHVTANEYRALKAWRKVRGDEPGPLFTTRQTKRGKGITQQALDLLVKQYGTLAGLPADKLHCHSFKHSCGTHLAQKGFGLESIQDHLGHRNVENTRKYSDFGGEIRQARDKRLRDW